MRAPTAVRGDRARASSARGACSTAPSRGGFETAHNSPRTPDADGTWDDEMDDEWIEAEAFSSVHDLVHHAILSQQGGSASLRQIYDTCERQGRIAYKRSGGSRIITANEHWKSQIRHALYTSPRFCRAPNMDDAWCVARGHDDTPATTTVHVNLSAASVTPSCARGVVAPGTASASSGRKRPPAALGTSAASHRSTSSNRLRAAKPVPTAAAPAISSASAAAGGRARTVRNVRNGVTSGGQAPGAGPSSRVGGSGGPARARLFTNQVTPEPATPDLMHADAPASILTGQAATRTAGAVRGLVTSYGVGPSTSSCSAAPPKKRLKNAANNYKQSDKPGTSRGYGEMDAEAVEEMGDASGNFHMTESFRDLSRNRRKPGKAPNSEYGSFGSPVFAETMPTPRDVSRNRRKGKAERAADGGPVSDAPVSNHVLSFKANLEVDVGSTAGGKFGSWSGLDAGRTDVKPKVEVNEADE